MSDTSSSKPSVVAQIEPVKGILKVREKTSLTAEEEEARRLKWDEDNLIFNESQKVPRMKIDEAATPFLYYHSSDDEGDEAGLPRLAAKPHGETVSSREEADAASEAKLRELNQKLLEVKEAKATGDVGPVSAWDASSSDGEDEEEQRKKRAAFKSKRKAHYNEWQRIQEAKRLMALEDEEQDE
eukprot:CAMPEP_0174231124 /NCGR_PEP_ID=MMETSP0417-20130205/1729_1 /TAXON_ID=242541 /ORGANISM="Mayorella sp, Strain BSH-02190019" /LENGTH=183 /DNA_ID=CAMNT_0015308949 /DNA_START=137 /DNA_END=685 /DNA_ORIENTATION=-